jgi:NADH-quinone oxidoreductase subunit J
MGHPSPIFDLLAAATTQAEQGPLPMVLFVLFGGITAGAGFSVAIAKNVVRAAVGLLFALAGMSGLYLLLSAEFIAAVQLVVYVGGTLILIVFGVMLTNGSPNASYSPKRWEIVWSCIVVVLVGVPLMAIMLRTFAALPAPGEQVAAPAPAATAPSESAVGAMGQPYPMSGMGRALLDPAGYLVPFELVSVLLLAVMIGAAYLAKGRKAKATAENSGGVGGSGA